MGSGISAGMAKVLAATVLSCIWSAESSSSSSTRIGRDGLLEMTLYEATLHGLYWPAEDLEEVRCTDKDDERFLEVLQHHLQVAIPRGVPPALPTLEFLSSAAARQRCPVGQAAALLVLAAGRQAKTAEEVSQQRELIARAEVLLRREALERRQGRGLQGRAGDRRWPFPELLRQLDDALPGGDRREISTTGCIVIIYAFPTEEIKADTATFFGLLEKHYFDALNVKYPIVLFTDPGTGQALAGALQELTTADLVIAVIPEEEISREMPAYSCQDGVVCFAGEAPESSAHRGVVNKTQFWSPDYLRISRYTAGPLFRHAALDRCSHFVKMDTDFYLTGPMATDPLKQMMTEGARLGYWQLQVQGQRQVGYTESALEFLVERDLKIRNRAFYARGRFEERAQQLGIPVEEVPEALEAATLLYGCFFGGEVSFFREPLYQDFFRHMDAKKGFESFGWSNQFFLGTAAAALLFPSQVLRLYISGRHQEAILTIRDGNLTEYLTGALRSVFR